MKSQRGMTRRHPWTLDTEMTGLLRALTITLTQMDRRRYNWKRIRIGYNFGF